MKKTLLLVLMFLLMLAGCSTQKEQEEKDLSIVSPTGAPALAFYRECQNADFETNSAPNNIISMMAAGQKDLVVIDAVSGFKAIASGADYQLAAILTFGNFYLASTGLDDNGTLDQGDKIVLFGQGMTPDLLFHYLFGNEFENDLEYVSNVQDAAKVLITGKNETTGSQADYVFIAQPVLTAAMNKNPEAAVYLDVQKAYQEKSGCQMIQAGVFVKNSSDKKAIQAYLGSLKNDIEELIADPDLLNTALSVLSNEEATALYGIDPAIATAVLKNGNGIGLGYGDALANKAAIDSFLNLFGMENSDEKVYFK